MDVISYHSARTGLKQLMDRVIGDRTQVVVTRRNSEPVVMLALSDWTAIEETLHLLSTPANAGRIRESIRQLDAGKGVERDLVDR